MSIAQATPLFDAVAPFGQYRLQQAEEWLIRFVHRLPSLGLLKPVALLLRRPLKYRLNTPVDIEAWGLKLRLLPRGNVSESRLLFVPQFFDRVERRALRRFLKPGCVFLDIGANAGSYSFWVYSLFGHQCRIYAVEPDPDMVERITFNKAANGASNLCVLPYALSDKPGEMLLLRSRINKGRNRLNGSLTPDEAGDPVMVRVKTLLELTRELGIEQIDALKIDVERHEYQVLAPFFAQAPKGRWPRMILCETGMSPEQLPLRQLLLDQGYAPSSRTRLNQVYYLEKQ